MEQGKTVAFATLGCKVNQYDTETMRALFEQAGYTPVPFGARADVYVVNTCTVTQMSDSKSRRMIARAHAQNPEAVIAVTGCYSQRAPEAVLALPGVRLVLGTKERARIVELAEQARQERLSLVEDIQKARDFEELPAAGDGGRTRAQLKIQDGCDRYCSYCIIPYARGPVRSRGLAEIEAEARRLAAAGYRELVLTGIHLMSYGKDREDGATLCGAIARVARVGGIARIRLGSLEPALIDAAFAQALRGEPKLCRQFHLSLQSGSAAVLARMNRRYTPEDYAHAAQLLRAAMPDCALTTDVIAGFPGETEQEHAESMAFVERMAFARIHVFPYSRREGTRAAGMPGQLPKAVKDARAHALIALGKRLTQAFLQAQLGTRHTVLVEKAEGGVCTGYTGNYIHARLRCERAAVGEIVPVRIVELAGETALAQIARE